MGLHARAARAGVARAAGRAARTLEVWGVGGHAWFGRPFAHTHMYTPGLPDLTAKPGVGTLRLGVSTAGVGALRQVLER